MANELRHFSSIEIYITKHEAWTIFRFFWPPIQIREESLTDDDIAFAQALFLEAIDASYKMGYVHILYDVFYGKIPGSFSDIGELIKKFAKKAAKHWFKHLGPKSLDDAEIYAAVRAQLAVNFKSAFTLRVQTGELIY